MFNKQKIEYLLKNFTSIIFEIIKFNCAVGSKKNLLN